MTSSIEKTFIGARFGRLVVTSSPVKIGDRHRVQCRCDCGKTLTVRCLSLANGNTGSCGCLHRENVGSIARTHGMSKTGTYNTYLNMVSRCTFEGHQDFAHYGGRGIKVCDRWLASFENFLSDMGVRPQRCTLERDDVNGNYEPGNCRWASWKDQQNNKRNNRLIEYAGRTQTLQQWADEVGFSHSLIIYRLARGWTVERALTIPPVSGRNQHTH